MPPSLARWLLEHALPADLRESVTGDPGEVFQRDCRRHGLPSARRHYWRQTISFTLHFVAEQWRDRRRGGPVTGREPDACCSAAGLLPVCGLKPAITTRWAEAPAHDGANAEAQMGGSVAMTEAPRERSAPQG
jgi:hypothetical protein